MVDRNGIANYNNADNANGVAPDLANQNWNGSAAVTEKVNNDPCERRDTSRDKSPKQPSDADARTLLAWWEDICA